MLSGPMVASTVREIMQRDVLTVLPDTSVRELTRLLSERSISGAPVVNRAGHVLGVVSATDIVRLAAEEADVHLADARWLAATPSPGGPSSDEDGDGDGDGLAGYFLPEEAAVADPDWESRMAEPALEDFRVEDIMTPVSFSVGPSTTVREVADFLVRGRIHRALVTEGDHLLGIVTTMDVLRAVAGDG